MTIASIDCTINFDTTLVKKAPTADAKACISSHELINQHIKFAESFLNGYCTGKKGYLYGHTWKTRNKKFYTDAQCKALGEPVDCYKALEKCAANEACEMKTKSRECKAPNDDIVFPAPDAAPDAATADAPPADAPPAEEAPAE